MYVERFYRSWVDREDLCRFRVKIRESDLLILCDQPMEEQACAALADVRRDIEAFIANNARFQTSLGPVEIDEERAAPQVVCSMLAAGRAWHVGPMAAVAGAVAQQVGERIVDSCHTVIVENGGDVYARTTSPTPLRFAIYAGQDSPFSDKLGFEIDARGGVGVCTSSGRVGPSLSFGCADAVVTVADDTAEADAAATALANQIHRPSDVDLVLRAAQERNRLRGMIACAGDRLGVWGDLELVRLSISDRPSQGGHP